MIHYCSSVISKCLDSAKVEKGTLGDVLESREDVFHPKMISELREGHYGMLQSPRVCPWRAGEGGGTSSLQLLTWVLLKTF